MTHACNPIMQEAETGGLLVWSQPGLHNNLYLTPPRWRTLTRVNFCPHKSPTALVEPDCTVADSWPPFLRPFVLDFLVLAKSQRLWGWTPTNREDTVTTSPLTPREHLWRGVRALGSSSTSSCKQNCSAELKNKNKNQTNIRMAKTSKARWGAEDTPRWCGVCLSNVYIQVLKLCGKIHQETSQLDNSKKTNKTKHGYKIRL